MNVSEEKKRLLTDLRNIAKQCEERFRGRTELATEYDERVVDLCQILEAVFSNGLRRNRSLRTITKSIASKGLSRATVTGDSVTFWLFVVHFLNKHDHERYLVLKNIHMDTGRGRAWLRSALNENSLKRYLLSMFDPSASPIVAQFYEEWAVISCADSRHDIIEAVTSLEGILFAISIDRAELNSDSDDSESVTGRNRKKDQEEPLPVFPVYSSSPSQLVRKAAPRIVCLADDDYSNDSDGPATSRQASYASLSSTPNASELETNNKLLLTPLEEDARSVGGLSSDDRTSNDLELERELTSSDEVREGGDEANLMESLTREVSRLREERDQLSSQNEQLKKMHAEKIARCESLIENMTKENDILKVQVKKYLSAIQMLNLKDEKAITPIDDDLVPSYVLFQEAQEYEKKLVQVAEMHGELVEFNDRLHRVIHQKEAMIKRLREELVELRGPLPEGVEVGEFDEISTVSDFSIPTITSSLSSRPLVNIWIPTAFLAGGQQKTSSHHVYQVYLRIKDEEWNVYRRYSQFHELHSKLRKKHPIVGSFDFPPKKTFSSRDARVVQERRKRLESYLRSVVNLIQMEHEVNDRKTLVAAIPFLSIGDEKSTKKRSSSRRRTTDSGDDSSEMPAGTSASSPPYQGL